MSTDTARAVADKYLEPLPLDLKGRIVRLAVFDSEDDCLFYYPRRQLGFQQKVNNFTSRQVRKRGGKVDRIHFTAAEYDGEDSDADRWRWIESRIGLVT